LLTAIPGTSAAAAIFTSWKKKETTKTKLKRISSIVWSVVNCIAAGQKIGWTLSREFSPLFLRLAAANQPNCSKHLTSP